MSTTPNQPATGDRMPVTAAASASSAGRSNPRICAAVLATARSCPVFDGLHAKPRTRLPSPQRLDFRPPSIGLSPMAHVPLRPPCLLSLAEVAEHLDLCTKAVRRWIERGDLHVHRLGRQLRVCEADLARFISQRRR